MSIKDFKRKTLRRSAAYKGISSDLRSIRKYLRDRKSPALIKQYIHGTEVRKLQLGSNRNVFDGWLNTDLHTIPGRAVALDVTRDFPIPDHTFDFIYSEHLIEHIPAREGKKMLKECNRVLKSGSGVLRIATPDLDKLLALRSKDLNADQENYIKSFVDLCLWDYTPYDPLEVINHAFKAWGHQFLYDEEHLVEALEYAGFTDVKRCEVGSSDHDELDGIETHGESINNAAMNRYETMVFEAKA